MWPFMQNRLNENMSALKSQKGAVGIFHSHHPHVHGRFRRNGGAVRHQGYIIKGEQRAVIFIDIQPGGMDLVAGKG